MPTFNTQQHTIHYVIAGRPEQPALLLLHGFLGSHADFLPLLPTLSQHFYCIVPDLPGHGKTLAKANTYNFSETANSLRALLFQLDISQTHLLGYSMGGRLALYFTCLFPTLVLRAVLESASPGLQSIEERTARQKKDDAIAHTLETIPLKTFLTRWYSLPLFSDLKQHDKPYQQMLERREINNPYTLAQALRGLSTGRQPPLWNNLKAIECPLLLLTGELDSKFVVLNQKMLAICHQNTASLATLAVIKNCGHSVHLVNPAAYLETVVQFLR
ncbi:MAG: 2-succinyl-6-hydroxy-2,4-cyclohexadiene-1-carboxylate synthase [Cyanobacteria bacterium J06649_4]